MLKFPSFRRRMAGVALVLATAAAVAPTAGLAHAKPAPQLQRWAITGENFGTFGSHSYCRGAVGVGLTSPHPGIVKVALRSHGFTGQGNGWKRAPRCRVLFTITTTSVAGHRESFVVGSFGTRPGQAVTANVATGPGLAVLNITPTAVGTPIRALQGSAYGAYVLVP